MTVADRRQLLATAAALALRSGAARAAAAPSESATQGSGSQGPAAQTPADTALLHMLDGFMSAQLERSPEQATTLGLDHGAQAGARRRLDDRSQAQREADRLVNAQQLEALRRIDRERLSPARQLDYDVLAYTLAAQAQADRRFGYGARLFGYGTTGMAGGGSPYVISQLTGDYQGVPLFLDTQHAIETAQDADDYLARLQAFPVALDQELEQLEHDVALGVIPPDFVLRATLTQLTALRDAPAASATLVTSVARRAQARGIPGDYAARATSIYTGSVIPAVQRQVAALQALLPRAVHTAGVSRLPDGEAYYAQLLSQYTTTHRTPAEIHGTGLELVASLASQLDVALKAQGLTEGAVGPRLAALFADPRFLYPNTDAGKARLIASLNTRVQAVQARLPAYFGVLPRAEVEIRRVPAAIEAGASSNYQPGSIDGSRPGVYYIVLRDTAEDPSWTLPTLTYHEAIPGHHLQLSLQQEADLPLIRKSTWFSAYGEGWALYAEQLADEMGLYADDPFGRIGYLHDAQLRAVRLVLDTGLHAMGWSREQAVSYYVDHLGDPPSAAISEVERYCVWPGQACSYMIGKLTWLDLRARARTRLGSHFDIRAFHDAGLTAGALPLDVMATAIDRRLKSNG